ncbi:MAG: MBL fold metallo-hydrolase [Methanomassiliicoccales archaeon]|jgi:L-ascorbate metabolism protein UlaG (beta-lactamase superfamily)|nr:MBL fold metallo-hydrolase [Methanomassiliicoccales archaeon]
MRIIWHGHACFEVQGERTVLMDPHDGKSLGIKAPSSRPDVVLVSHDHFDHNCVRVVKGDFAVVKEPGEHQVKGLRVLGIEACHDEAKGSKRGKVVMYRFELGGASFLHCGDLGHPLDESQLREVGRVDILFVPVGGVFTLDGAKARGLVEAVRPRIAIPMHYRYGGLALSIQTADDFLTGVPRDKVVRVGNEADITREELPQETEYWVFSP